MKRRIKKMIRERNKSNVRIRSKNRSKKMMRELNKSKENYKRWK